MELLGFIDQGAAICVPEEAAELRKKDDEQHWHQRREKNAWLMGCAHVIREYDLASPIEVFAKMAYRSPLFNESAADIAEQYMQIPEQLRDCSLENGMIVYQEQSMTDKQWKGVLKDIQNIQEGKDFYIPSEKEIQELMDEGYPKSDPVNNKMFAALLKNGLEPFEADKAISDMLGDIRSGAEMHEIADDLKEIGLAKIEEDAFLELCQIIVEMNNNTRMYIHRGHTPIEMMKSDLKKNMHPTDDGRISADSTLKAENMKANLEALKALGFDADTEEQASFMNVDGKMHKVYPNDLCPCGSGKLFKDCHGKEEHNDSGNMKS